MISYDLETHLVQPGLLAPPIVCGSVAVRKKDNSCASQLLTKRMCLPELRVWLETQEIIGGMNIAYDFGCAAAEDPSILPLIFSKYERGQVHDVGVAMMLHLIALGAVHDQKLFDPRTGGVLKDPHTGTQVKRVSLEICVDLCLGRINAKENDRFRLSYALLENTDPKDWPEDARQYPVDDAVNGLEVMEWQATNCRNLCDLRAQCETAWDLHLASMWGIRTNGEKVSAMEKALLKKRALDVAFAFENGLMREEKKKGVMTVVKNTKIIKDRVVAAYNGTPPTTDKGGVSTARETLESSGDEVLERFAEVSNTEKRLTTYLPVLQQAVQVPLNVRFNALLANGRVSADGIIQTMERKGPVRECCEARPGTKWSSVDWTAAEMSGLGQVCLRTVGESRLVEVLKKGMDPHALFAAEMSLMSYEDFMAKLAAKSVQHKDLRQATKTADFGFNGMMGEATFVLQKRREKMENEKGELVSIRVCQLMRTAERCGEEMITIWKDRSYSPMCKACVLAAAALKKFYLYRMWPEMPKYFAWIAQQLEQSDQMTSLISGRTRGGLHGPSAANNLFSSIVADMAKWVLRKMTRECYLDTGSPLFGSRVILFQHDETILEIPDNPKYGTQTQAALRQAEIHKEAGALYCPDCPPDAEPALMSTWYKDAKAVYADGKLVPWVPKAA